MNYPRAYFIYNVLYGKGDKKEDATMKWPHPLSVCFKQSVVRTTDYSERKVKRLKSVMVKSLSIDCR